MALYFEIIHKHPSSQTVTHVNPKRLFERINKLNLPKDAKDDLLIEWHLIDLVLKGEVTVENPREIVLGLAQGLSGYLTELTGDRILPYWSEEPIREGVDLEREI